MLTTWLTLRQAQEALKNGRLEEAFRLAGRPDVQGHKRAGEILQQVGQSLLSRAQLHLRHADNAAAWGDLVLAEQAGIRDKTAVGLRQELVQRSLDEVRVLLSAGEPGRAGEIIQQLRGRGVQPPDLKVLEDIAHGWGQAQELAAHGELGQAAAILDHMNRLGSERFKPLDELRQDVVRRQKDFEPALMKLHQALENANWRDVIPLADQVLALAPQQAAALKARARAWKAVEPPTASWARANGKPIPMVQPADDQPRRMLLWIDGVGGYLVCLSPRVSFGQATPDASVDIPLYADISRLHAYLTRDAEGYMLEAVRQAAVNQKPVERALLRDGDRVTFGKTCQLIFHQPVPVSATARLELTSSHRLPLAVGGVLLMADNCVLGPSKEAHVEIPNLRRPIVLFRRKDGLGIRATGEFTVDGQRFRDKAALGAQSTVTADDFRLTLEPLGARVGKVKV